MKQTLQINIIPLSLPAESLEFPFYTSRVDNSYPIFDGDAKEIFKKHFPEKLNASDNRLYTTFAEPANDAVNIKVELAKFPYLTNHYFRYLLKQYFSNVADIINPNFTSEIEVFFKAPEQPNELYTLYNQFTLKIQYNRITEGHELVLSYDSTTKVYNDSLQDLQNFPTDKLNYVKCGNRLYKYKYMPPELKQDLNEIFPVISNELKKLFRLPFDKPDFKNRYPKYKKLLLDFYNKHLNNASFRSILPISPEGFLSVPESKIQILSSDSNKLLFGKNTLGIYPGRDLLNHGPYKPPAVNNVRFFFIYWKQDRESYVIPLYNYFKNGFFVKDDKGSNEKIFPDIKSYIKQPLLFEENFSISFDLIKNAVSTVQEVVRNKTFIPDTQYIAIYVSPVSKAETDPDKFKMYYQIKEILLKYDITSQVVYKENIKKPKFNIHLPNIEIAILAKLGGIPWRLNRSVSSELIVGIGAFYSQKQKSRFLGSAFCFNNEGVFENFDCFLSDDTEMLAGSISKAVHKFLDDHKKADRLIIHFYKDISKKEMQPIVDTLRKLDLDIPVIIITINKTESKDLLAFDISNENLMPYSGTFIQVGKVEYLLFNNTRYSGTSKVSDKEYHFPIKLSFASSQPEILNDKNTVNELIDQVYQFSRMYWKSVSQQNLPVTICYPEMVAEIFPHFQSETLPPFGQKNLWFL